MPGPLNDLSSSSTDDDRVPTNHSRRQQLPTNLSARQGDRSPVRGRAATNGFGRATNSNSNIQHRSGAPSSPASPVVHRSSNNSKSNGYSNNNNLVVCDESRHTKFPFSIAILS